MTFIPAIDLFFSLILRIAVTLLNFTDQLIAFPFDHRHIIVGQFAPLLFHFAFKLFPVAADFVFIHHQILGSQ